MSDGIDIKIEKNVPPPKPRPQFRKHLNELDVDDSFKVDIEYWASLRNAAGSLNRMGNKKFTVKKVKERPKRGAKMQEFARVWRIK